MSERQRVITEWDEEEQAEEIGSPTLRAFGRNFAAALWPVIAAAVIIAVIIVWISTHSG